MSIPHALRLSRAPAAALMAVGVVWGGFAALVPDIKAGVGASDAAFGAALLMSAVGGMLAMWAAPWAGRRLGRLALPLLGAVACVTVMMPAFAEQRGDAGAGDAHDRGDGGVAGHHRERARSARAGVAAQACT